MKVNYTLPGLLPEAVPQSSGESGAHTEPFGAHLQRMRTPERTDWRSVLHLNAAPAGSAGIGPPPAQHSASASDGASERGWWRAALDRHTRQASGSPVPSSVHDMIALLTRAQRLENEVFARHFAEAAE
jgi:hypothetical protein